MDAFLQEVLKRPRNLVFPSNRARLPDLGRTGGQAVRHPTGHLLFYGPHGRRILATDPDGHPLHECEWSPDEQGGVVLSHARFLLDWGRWVGLRPSGIVHATTLDLSTKPSWQRLTADDLRHMASQAMRVPLDEVRFFYCDEDLSIDPAGQVTIRHRKDAFYVLEDGDFGRARFMACLGAMHWERIDFLPVVELFQSLLPGTGSAAFELIRGLYDDQNPGEPFPLRYRGIPTYPSEAAFRLFSGFFTPRVKGAGDPLALFMDPSKSHEVTWLPNSDPPRRFFDEAQQLCVTVRGEHVTKVTRADDSSGLSFVAPSLNGFAPCDRWVGVMEGSIVLNDGEEQAKVQGNAVWGRLKDSWPMSRPMLHIGWRALLGDSFQPVAPATAYSAVLLYPEGQAEIGELAAQPFAADYLQDVFEQDEQMAARIARADRILVENFDGALSTCLHLDRIRQHTLLYRYPEFAQKCAQTLWNILAQSQRLDWAKGFQFAPLDQGGDRTYAEQYHLIYCWVPFSLHDQEAALDGVSRRVSGALLPGGLACLVGPGSMRPLLDRQRFQVLHTLPLDQLPPFRMHQALLPQSRLKPGLTLFLAHIR